MSRQFTIAFEVDTRAPNTVVARVIEVDSGSEVAHVLVSMELLNIVLAQAWEEARKQARPVRWWRR